MDNEVYALACDADGISVANFSNIFEVTEESKIVTISPGVEAQTYLTSKI